jgi:hypothetical protein
MFLTQQTVDILNILYDGEYNINYSIWLIINEWSKECARSSGRAAAFFSASG